MAEIRYLGIAGWHLRAGEDSLLIDPYFTRLSLWRALVGYASPDVEAVAAHTPPARWVLVTHPHYDHLADVPAVARLTGARVYASAQGCRLLTLLGTPGEEIAAGDRLDLGVFRVEVYESRHRTLFRGIPFAGPLRPGLRPPLRVSDFRVDVQFSFRIQVDGVRVLVASGIDHEPAVEADLLLVGADATRDQLATILGATRPRLVMPNHWDDLFQPLSKQARPMFIPPRGVIPSFRRIDLDAFARRVKELCPGAEVIVPCRFETHRLSPG